VSRLARTGTGLLIAAATTLFVFEPRAALANQAIRVRAPGSQVVTLSERAGTLEKEVVEIAKVTPPLETTAPITIETFKPSVEHSGAVISVDTLPITWATDWRAYQPAGIIATPAPIVLEWNVSEPARFKKWYVGYAALQAGDIITTITALNRDAREANPLLRDVARSPVKLLGVKAATTMATILAIESMRKRHPVVARVTLIAINATLAAVTINNVSAAHRTKRVDP
jgi:hypothetical protein